MDNLWAQGLMIGIESNVACKRQISWFMHKEYLTPNSQMCPTGVFEFEGILKLNKVILVPH